MSEIYDGYYDDVKPIDFDKHEQNLKSDVLKKALILIGGLVVFVSAAVALAVLVAG